MELNQKLKLHQRVRLVKLEEQPGLQELQKMMAWMVLEGLVIHPMMAVVLNLQDFQQELVL
jgi:hypothetical protein